MLRVIILKILVMAVQDCSLQTLVAIVGIFFGSIVCHIAGVYSLVVGVIL